MHCSTKRLLASAAKKFVIVVEERKLVDQLGKFPLPVEVFSFACPLVERKLRAMGARPVLRTIGADAFITQEGNLILDCHFEVIPDPQKTAAEIAGIVGVVEHGLFLGMADTIVVSTDDGVRLIEARSHS